MNRRCLLGRQVCYRYTNAPYAARWRLFLVVCLCKLSDRTASVCVLGKLDEIFNRRASFHIDSVVLGECIPSSHTGTGQPMMPVIQILVSVKGILVWMGFILQLTRYYRYRTLAARQESESAIPMQESPLRGDYLFVR